MKKDVAIKLHEKANEVAMMFSMENRSQNHNNEKFSVCDIDPLSETTACVTYQKDTGKKACGFFFFLTVYKEWRYFFPTDAHILGMEKFNHFKVKVEKTNYPKNF